MSDSEPSIEARSIINSLAATSSFSAVGFRAGWDLGCDLSCDLADRLVFNWDAITHSEKAGAHLSACGGRTQELIDRLTKSPTSSLIRPAQFQPIAKTIREKSD